MTDSLAQQLHDLDVRFDHVIWVPAINALDEALPDVFEEEFCDWLPQDLGWQIYNDLPELIKFADGDDTPQPEDVAQAIYERPGFLIQLATPVREYFAGGNCWTSSWSHYQTEWIYVDKSKDFVARAKAWAEPRHEKMRANARGGA